jgi:23S rRNA (uridine2552-2'-O)-methyltransferase
MVVRLTLAVGRRAGSSAAWLNRQASDPFVAEAKRRGLRSRAALKLEEIDRKLRLFRPGMVVVDLGASPGSWSQIAAGLVGARGRIIAADLLPIAPLPLVTALQMDLTAAGAIERIRLSLPGDLRADVVMNDMAPNTTGQSAVDCARSVALCEIGLDVASAVLCRGGALLSKVFMGGGEVELRARLARCFERVLVLKPQSSRKESREVYIAALGFRPTTPAGVDAPSQIAGASERDPREVESLI